MNTNSINHRIDILSRNICELNKKNDIINNELTCNKEIINISPTNDIPLFEERSVVNKRNKSISGSRKKLKENLIKNHGYTEETIGNILNPIYEGEIKLHDLEEENGSIERILKKGGKSKKRKMT